jgi:hypothetical protein
MNSSIKPSRHASLRIFLVLIASLILSSFLISSTGTGCSAPASGGYAAETIAASYGDPQPVIILGYTGDAMEPFISRDGAYLFFNNSNDPSVDTDLFWARRIDDLTFAYLGEIAGVNLPALDAVASMDEDGVFYFVSTRDYTRTFSVLFRGLFWEGEVAAVEPVEGIARGKPPYVNFDAEIDAAGTTLYYVDGRLNPAGGMPKAADILMARRGGAGFTPDPDAEKIMEQVNTNSLEYAPAITADGLILFFTRLRPLAGLVPIHVGIYVTARKSIGEPFGAPALIEAADGFVEAPTVAPDGSLYYHKKDSGRFIIYRLARKAPAPVEEK